MPLAKGAGPAPATTGGQARKVVLADGLDGQASRPTPNRTQIFRLELTGAKLCWKRIGTGRHLFNGRRRFGQVIPDRRSPGMWRSVLAHGRLSDLANISWAKHAVFEAAIRELEWEVRNKAAMHPQKCPENWGVFGTTSPPIAQTDGAATPIVEAAK